MMISKNTLFRLNHQRKGLLTVKATEDFDTEKAEWYPIIATHKTGGINTFWVAGERISCRASFCNHITILLEQPFLSEEKPENKSP